MCVASLAKEARLMSLLVPGNLLLQIGVSGAILLGKNYFVISMSKEQMSG